MASLLTLERRIAALEARLADIESGYGETIYKMHRTVVGVQIGQSRILDHLGLGTITNEEIDQALDDEAGT